MKLNILVLVLLLLAGNAAAAAAFCTDVDGDGYAVEGGSCGAEDCDDSDPGIHPGALEVCDGLDSNCDGWKPPTDIDSDGDGIPLCASDCNDYDATIYPDAPELCDGKDNDCNWYIPRTEYDHDGDGVRMCDIPADCNDRNPAVSPYNREVLGDGLDNDCNGRIDDNGMTVCIDRDNDGFMDSTCGGSDCDDNNSLIYPGAEELCDGRDTDCNGSIPFNEIDHDGDGSSVCNGDCDDSDASVSPSETALCTSGNSNCSGVAKLMWGAPPADGDGSALTDLAGYTVYYGQASNDYTWALDVGDTTCHAIAGFPQGQWCFAITAYDFSGNESSFSNEACKTMGSAGIN